LIWPYKIFNGKNFLKSRRLFSTLRCFVKGLLRRIYFLPLSQIALAVYFVLLFGQAAFARFGGGGGYSGRGRGGSGGGNGNSGDAEIIFLLIELCFRHPLIGAPVTVVVLIVLASKAKNSHVNRTIKKNVIVQNRESSQKNLSLLKEKDPAFDEGRFLQRVRNAFASLQEAWCAQDLSTVRSFLSDSIFERCSLQFDEQKRLGYRDHMEGLKVFPLSVVEFRSNNIFDAITVRIRAKAVDYRADLKTGNYLSGSKQPEEFEEHWSFIRRLGVKTTGALGLMENNCPNCGAGLSINQASKCDACGSLIKSGKYDWVLAEITQGSEWRPTDEAAIPGLSEYSQYDSSFSVQELEDRTSVIFWRYIAALQKGSVDPLRKMAGNEYCELLSDELKSNSKKARLIPVECAVGAVETQGIVKGSEWDEALVLVRWSGAYKPAEEGYRTPGSTAGARIKDSMFLLKRKHGVKSDKNSTLSSAHCSSCGGPVEESAADACEYCGAILNDGGHGWILSQALPPTDPKIMEFRSKIKRAEDQTQSYFSKNAAKVRGVQAAAWVVQVLLADAKIDKKERKILDKFCLKRGISKLQAENLIMAGLAGKLEAPVPESDQEAKEWLESMVEMALADGALTKVEMKVLEKLSNNLGFVDYDMKRLVKKTRERMYKEARVELKKIRK